MFARFGGIGKTAMAEHARDLQSRDHGIETSNDRIFERAARLHLDRIPVLCECGQLDCAATFFVTPGEYAEARAAGTPLYARHSR